MKPSNEALQVFYGSIPAILAIVLAVWNNNSRLTSLETSLNKRIDSLEISLNKRIDDLKTYVTEELRDIKQRLTNLESYNKVIK